MSLKVIDIAVNLTDSVFHGIYHERKKHESDFDLVLERAKAAGVESIIVTGTSLQESENALKLSLDNPMLYCTVGCHPTNSQDFLKNPNLLESLILLAKKGIEAKKVVAVGEFGLDYDRLNYCPADVQLKYFDQQFELARQTNLPMFLHSRNTNGDMIKMLKKHNSNNGVVHSFTGTWEEAKEFLDMGLYISVNGCSLRTRECIDVVRKIPMDRLCLETDAPWCDLRPTHASFEFQEPYFNVFPEKTNYEFPKFCYEKRFKPEKFQMGKMVSSRNEPALVIKVLSTLAKIRNEDVGILAQQVYKNTKKLFKI